MLFRPEAFERLTDEPWDAERIRGGIREIVADTDAALRGPKLLWRADDWDRWRATSPMKNLYVGAAGVLYALDRLRWRGHAETGLCPAELALAALERFIERPDYFRGIALPEPRESSLLCGETGVLLVASRLAASADVADDLFGRVRANVANEAEDVMWGAPGTLVAARWMHEWTGEERWSDVWRESAAAVLARRLQDGFWTQRLYGWVGRDIGPAPGMVGNVRALLGGNLLPSGERATLRATTARALERSAVVEDGLASWPMSEGRGLVSEDGQIRLQWCHGAPGVVWAAAPYLDEGLLLAGAELVWRAGPHGLDKGPGICHGTAGNGYALLAAFERTGDERWLERARRFAVHALEQVRRLRAARGRGRYSLWTGDVGVVLYLADCLEARAAYPLFDG